MFLSKLYSNKPTLFPPITFVEKLNVVLAEIRLSKNKNRDTHNLGKTTVGRLLDFCFLTKKTKNSKNFLFRNSDLFSDFVFYLEIKLDDDFFLTISRSVKEPTLISFKKHDSRHQNFSKLTDQTRWDHYQLSFDRSKSLLDSYLDWEYTKPWNYRDAIGYQIRSEDDYQDIFHLSRYAGKHKDWKPYLSNTLGFDSEIISNRYLKEEELESKKRDRTLLEKELRLDDAELQTLNVRLKIKTKEYSERQNNIDLFDFRAPDTDITQNTVEEIDNDISDLNYLRYSLLKKQKKITSALNSGKILFDPDKAKKIFEEVGILFPDQLSKDYEQLIDFNKAITSERKRYLKEDLGSVNEELEIINKKLLELGESRGRSLSYISGTDIFEKYKQLSKELVELKAELITLESQVKTVEKIKKLDDEIHDTNIELAELEKGIIENISRVENDNNSVYSKVQIFFDEIIRSVLAHSAYFYVSTNTKGHIEFKAKVNDLNGNPTQADLGHTYRKLLCIAYDLAVMRAYQGQKAPRFVYFDSVFDGLDDRKKEKLLSVIHDYSVYGIQTIITLIDSEKPAREDPNDPVFSEDEIILELHDDGIQGLLFKIKPW